MSVTIPRQAIQDSASAGDLWQLVLALAWATSNWDATAEGSWKAYRGGPQISANMPGAFATAYGYTLWDTDGGLGDGIAPAILLDGRTHMRLTGDYLRAATRANKGDLNGALSAWPARAVALSLYQRIKVEGIKVTETGEVIPPTALDNGAPGGWAPRFDDVDIAGVVIPGSIIPVVLGLAAVGLIIAVME